MLFLSTYINKVDKKGRVSIPASFRAALEDKYCSDYGLYVIAYNSFINPCIEACSENRIQTLHDNIDRLDPYSETRDAFATTILGGCVPLTVDNEGRVILPEKLIAYASLEEQACFVGKGETFEIWNSAIFEEYAARARELAKKDRLSLQLVTKG